jgi:hypothetical protein
LTSRRPTPRACRNRSPTTAMITLSSNGRPAVRIGAATAPIVHHGVSRRRPAGSGAAANPPRRRQRCSRATAASFPRPDGLGRDHLGNERRSRGAHGHVPGAAAGCRRGYADPTGEHGEAEQGVPEDDRGGEPGGRAAAGGCPVGRGCSFVTSTPAPGEPGRRRGQVRPIGPHPDGSLASTGRCPRGPLSDAEARHMLDFDGVTKRFGPVLALDRCSFSARPGRLTGFLGRTGPARRRPCARCSGSSSWTRERSGGTVRRSAPRTGPGSGTCRRSGACIRGCGSGTSWSTSASCAGASPRMWTAAWGPGWSVSAWPIGPQTAWTRCRTATSSGSS